jgi:hypothetical protein
MSMSMSMSLSFAWDVKSLQQYSIIEDELDVLDEFFNKK